MIKFEYKTIEIECKIGFTKISIDLDKVNQTFNQLGSEGWELVTSAVNNNANGFSPIIYYTFKRQI